MLHLKGVKLQLGLKPLHCPFCYLQCCQPFVASTVRPVGFSCHCLWFYFFPVRIHCIKKIWLNLLLFFTVFSQNFSFFRTFKLRNLCVRYLCVHKWNITVEVPQKQSLPEDMVWSWKMHLVLLRSVCLFHKRWAKSDCPCLQADRASHWGEPQRNCTQAGLRRCLLQPRQQSQANRQGELPLRWSHYRPSHYIGQATIGVRTFNAFRRSARKH